ncbi:spermine/spermidine synthase family protein [Viridothelium virens]|uniref:Spermine/spermidine synthase family protein n=1 Tax=Viridothelium virens TaxID=1048519 RepID=A0A6A6HEQ6_VIRVR|nr:spermine/spermidine synthase family protein [Viridothelium virens]
MTKDVHDGKSSPSTVKNEENILSLTKSFSWSIAILALAAISSPVAQLNLSPVYGSIPAARFHREAMIATLAVSVVLPRTVIKSFTGNLSRVPTVLAALAPFAEWILFSYSNELGPLYGPLCTETLTFYPLLLFSLAAAMDAMDNLAKRGISVLAAPMVPAVVSLATFYLFEIGASSFLPSNMGSTDLLNRCTLWIVLACGFSFLSRSKVQLLVIPLLLGTLVLNPHYNGIRNTTRLNKGLQPYGWSVLARKESVTGYISVLKSEENQFQLLRCDHSLLGGEWLVTPKLQEQGITKRESVYAVFSMLEAVRLVENKSKRDDEDKSALVVGLGIGTAPNALIAHGINTTIVEVDPVVHEFATKYFSLNTDHIAVLQDAVPWVDAVSRTSPASYDFIIHDVFTGGAEPASLFTVEFLSGLSNLLKDDGVIAINYAGDLNLPTTALVLRTIHNVFPTCRMFRDAAPSPNESSSDFINMVLFCIKPTNQENKIVFRKPVDADFLGSVGRRQHLAPKPEHEIPFPPPIVKGSEEQDESTSPLLRKDAINLLEKYQFESAARHWRIMRDVVPSVVWEKW